MEITDAREITPKTDFAAHEAFRRAALWLRNFLRLRGIETTPWISEDLPLFSSQSFERQNQIVEELQDWIDVLKSAEQSNEISGEISGADGVGAGGFALKPLARKDSTQRLEQRILWRILNRNKMKFPSDLFERLPVDSVVEVYTAENRQIYRSLNFLKVCTYTLEEIYVWPWFELYERESTGTRQTLGVLERAVRGELRGIVDENFDSHWVNESKQGHTLRTSIQPTMICFFEDEQSRLTGYIYAFRILD